MSSFRVLVFSRTLGFRHDSIPDGIAAIQSLGQAHGFQVQASEDPSLFSDTGLSGVRVVIFLNTSGNVLNDDQQQVFERFIQSGGGFVGVHSASDTEYGWPWYGGLVGAYFDNHPAIQPAVVQVVGAAHPSTAGLPASWSRTDEWYNFRRAPEGVEVLLRLDEGSYSGGTMGDNHPIAWCHTYTGGRSWYTGLGHTSESYADPLFQQHLLGGIRWAAGHS
jgi:type 1 glutamine amidotransferase